MWSWLDANKEWLFQGLGVLILGAIIQFFRKRRASTKQVIRSGKNSTNIQAGRDISIVDNKKSNVEQD